MACGFSFALYFVSVVIHSVTSASYLISGYEYDPPTSVEISFMKRYGYLQAPAGQSEEFEHALTPDTVAVALKRFQAFVGVPQTGNLDLETKKWITKKRCGVKDVYDDGARRRRRSDPPPRGWTKKTITYRVVNGSSNNPRMTKARVEEMVAAAFDVWAPYSGLTFVRKERGEADIMITFVTGNHGDGNPFDGPGIQLAHTFDPPIGDIHFDDEEHWVRASELDENDEGTDFEATVLHEIGHALGLRHTTVKEAVMFPYYREGSLSLYEHDILELRKIYSWSNPTPLTKAADPPSLCEADYDSIQVIQGKIFVFKDDWIWLFSKMRVLEHGYPRKIHDVFIGLPIHVTVVKAVYEKMNGNIDIFAGRLFWEFSPSLSLQRRGELSEYSIPRHIPELTTVFQSNFNNRTYFINNDRFWRYDEETREMDPGYPKSMDRWRKIPYPVTAAVVWDEDTYFFKGPRFWNFDNRLVQARTTMYPQPVTAVWFPCNYTSDMAQYLTYGDDEIKFN